MIKRDPTRGWPRTTSQVVSTPMVVKAISSSDPSIDIKWSPGGSIYAAGTSTFTGGTNIYNGLTILGGGSMFGAHNASSGYIFNIETSRDTGGLSTYRVHSLGDVLIKSSTNAPQTLKLQTQGGTSESLVIEDLRDSSTVLSIDVDGNFSGTSSATSWKTFTPTISSSGWALGNGTATARYTKIGKTISFEIKIVFGSTSTFGATVPRIKVTPGADTIKTFENSFNITYKDDTTGLFYAGRGITVSAYPDAVALYTTGSPMSGVTDTVPFTWAINDSLVLSGTYEIA